MKLQPGPPTGGGGGGFSPSPSLKGAPGGPIKGPSSTCLKNQYALIEQSDLDNVKEQPQYSSEEQCSKLINKEIWLVRGSYCHCQQVMNNTSKTHGIELILKVQTNLLMRDVS